MSRSVDLFIDSELSLPDLAARLHQLSGVGLVPAREEDCLVMAGSAVQARLSGHDYLDDHELCLSRYRYVLSARVPGDVNPRDSKEASVLRSISQTLRSEMAVLLVLDLQYRDVTADQGQGGEGHPGDDPVADSSGADSSGRER